MSNIARLAAACALATTLVVARPADEARPAGAIAVEVVQQGGTVVRLVDVATARVVVQDRLGADGVHDRLVSPAGDVVVLTLGDAGGEGDSLAVYAIDPSAAPAGGRRVGEVAQVLRYRPRDGRVSVLLRPVPNGTVLEVTSGRHAPLWRKVFFRDRERRRWLEWPRELAPAEATDGVPTRVGDRDNGLPYAAWLRPPG